MTLDQYLQALRRALYLERVQDMDEEDAQSEMKRGELSKNINSLDLLDIHLELEMGMGPEKAIHFMLEVAGVIIPQENSNG